MSSPSCLKSTEPDHIKYILAIKGAGAAVPTVEAASAGGAGAGMTLTRNGAGDITVTFKEVPGVYLGKLESFDANAEADVDGWSVVVDRDAGSATTLRFIINNEALAAADLPANTWLYIEFNFRKSPVKG